MYCHHDVGEILGSETLFSPSCHHHWIHYHQYGDHDCHQNFLVLTSRQHFIIIAIIIFSIIVELQFSLTLVNTTTLAHHLVYYLLTLLTTTQ